MAPIYGLEPDPATLLMSRSFGATLFHLGLVLCLVRGVRDPATQRGLVIGGVAGSAAGLAVALMGQISGLVNAMGWSTVAIYGLLLLGYVSFLRPRPAVV